MHRLTIATSTLLLIACATGQSANLPSKVCLPSPAKSGLSALGQKNEQEKSLSIVGGELVFNTTDIERSTIGIQGLYQIDGKKLIASTCTAVVAAGNILITAAHCLDEPEGNITSRQLFAIPGFSLRQPNEGIKIIKSAPHPLYNSEFHDIAVLQLEKNLPTEIPPAKFLDDISLLKKSTPVVLIGYGTSKDNTEDFGIKRRTESMLDSLINSANFPATRIINQIRVRDAGGQMRGACHGDSGGPGFIKSSSLVFGIVQGINATVQSKENMNCTSADLNYTLISPYKGWIEKTAGIKLPTQSASFETLTTTGVSSSNGTHQNRPLDATFTDQISRSTGHSDILTNSSNNTVQTGNITVSGIAKKVGGSSKTTFINCE